MDRDYRFADFLQRFSDCFDGKERKVLKFLLSNHLPLAKLAEKNASGMTFFNALETKGDISSTDVNLLSEIAKLTENKPAKSCIDEYMKVISDRAANGSKGLSLYRRTLYSCLSAVDEDASGEEQSDLHRLIQHYKLESLDFKNKWDVVFYLEKQRMLKSDNKQDLDRFTSCLNAVAKDILKSFYSSEEQQQDANEAEEPAATKENKESQTRTASVTPSKIYSTKNLNGLIFAVSTWWEDEEKKIDMLKVLLCEFISSIGDLEEKDSPYDLLNLLIGPGVVSSSDASVIIEVAFLCDLQGVESKIMKHVPSFLGFDKFTIHKFSSHRRNLIEFGKKLRAKTSRAIADMCKIRSKDKWALIFELEAKGVLTEERKDAFVKELKENGMEEEAKSLNTYQ